MVRDMVESEILKRFLADNGLALPVFEESLCKAIGGRSRRRPKLGSGERFEQLRRELAARGVRNPDALAAWIGRKKHGKKKMAELAAHGRRES